MPVGILNRVGREGIYSQQNSHCSKAVALMQRGTGVISSAKSRVHRNASCLYGRNVDYQKEILRTSARLSDP